MQLNIGSEFYTDGLPCFSPISYQSCFAFCICCTIDRVGFYMRDDIRKSPKPITWSMTHLDTEDVSFIGLPAFEDEVRTSDWYGDHLLQTEDILILKYPAHPTHPTHLHV